MCAPLLHAHTHYAHAFRAQCLPPTSNASKETLTGSGLDAHRPRSFVTVVRRLSHFRAPPMSTGSESDLRRDVLTNTWVACAPGRGDRPIKTQPSPPDAAPTEDTPVDGCPFCPGHEDQLPDILWELGAEADRPWRTRSVPNKFSALSPAATNGTTQTGLYHTRTNHGRQEVIIDTPFHNEPLSRMPVEQVEALLQTYRERYQTLRATTPALYPFVFRNHGGRAGASIPHPHSQVIAMDVVPPRIEREEQAARARYEETGQCPYCEMIDRELADESRLVWTNEEFVVFVPYAAQVPCEMWMLPRTHEAEFGRMDETQRTALATGLQTAVARLHRHLDNPPFNLFIRTALEYESNAPHLHWSLRLQPRTSTQAGFELSTGVRINPSTPERDAAALRTAT